MNRYNIKDLTSPNRERMEKTFNKIYEEYSYLVFYVAFEILRNKEDAKDVVNETFLKMYQNRHSLERGKNLKYYLVTIAKNLAINNSKISARYVELNEDKGPGIVETYEDFDSYINKFKDFLDEEELTLVVYHLLYDYSFKEIAEIKQVSINSISSKYKRTLDKIRRHYGR